MNTRLRLMAWQFEVMMDDTDRGGSGFGSGGGPAVPQSGGEALRAARPHSARGLGALLRRLRRTTAMLRSQ